MTTLDEVKNQIIKSFHFIYIVEHRLFIQHFSLYQIQFHTQVNF